MKRDEESFTCVREEKDNILFDESMKQREEPEKKDGGPFDPSKNEHSIEKKEKDILKRDEGSFTCVREKDKAVCDESMKQREEPAKKDGGPFDPSKNEQNIEKKEEKNLTRDEGSFTCVREEKDNVVFDESMKQREEPEKKDGGPFDPSKNQQNIEKKEGKNLKRDGESFTCVREKDKAVLDERTKQRDEPAKKDGGPFDPARMSRVLERRKKRF